MPRNPLIGFNSDEDTKRLASILAAKLKFDNVSDMLRELLRREFKDNFTPKQVSDLLGLSVQDAQALLRAGESENGAVDPKGTGRDGKAA